MISAPIAGRAAPQPSPTRRDYLSYSAVGSYQRCPLAFYFHYVEGLPETTVSSSLVFGGAVHRAFEHHFNELLAGAEPPSLEALLGEYEAAWQGYGPDAIRFGKDEQRDGLTSLAQRMLATFQASSLAKTEGTILGVEEELRGADCSRLPGHPGPARPGHRNRRRVDLNGLENGGKPVDTGPSRRVVRPALAVPRASPQLSTP